SGMVSNALPPFGPFTAPQGELAQFPQFPLVIRQSDAPSGTLSSRTRAKPRMADSPGTPLNFSTSRGIVKHFFSSRLRIFAHHSRANVAYESVMMESRAGRPVVQSTRGLVTSPHVLASQAGADVLKEGGSAVDAAVTASAVLSVVYPHMTGIGGDAFWLIYDAKARAVRYLDGGGRAAARGTIDAFARLGLA